VPGPRIRRYFLEYSIKKVMIDEFLAVHFKDAGYSHLQLFKTPTGYRVIIYAEYPGRFIGRGGSILKRLAMLLQTHFGLENVNITVSPVQNPDLNARVVAYRIAKALEKGIPYRRVAMVMLHRIMAAGAIGAEITISGKLRTERARSEKFRAGKVYKAGELVEYMVDRAVAAALLKPGVYGIEVIIVKPGLKAPDYIGFKPVKLDELEELKKTIQLEQEARVVEASSGEA